MAGWERYRKEGHVEGKASALAARESVKSPGELATQSALTGRISR